MDGIKRLSGVILLEILRWSRRFSGLLGVLGALIIFFSWAISNTYKERSTALKNAIETARRDFILQTQFLNIQQAIHVHDLASQHDAFPRSGNPIGLAHLVGIAGSQFVSPAAVYLAHLNLNNEMITLENSTYLFQTSQRSARLLYDQQQVILLLAKFSDEVGTQTESHEAIEQQAEEINGIAAELLKREQAVGEALGRVLQLTGVPVGAPPPLQPFDREAQAEARNNAIAAIWDYITYYNTVASPTVQERQRDPKTVGAFNTRSAEADERLEKAKNDAEWYSTAAIYCYFIGSVLALYGLAVDKLAPMEKDSGPLVRPPHQEIQVEAYCLWEKDGCPFGRDEYYWMQAVQNLRTKWRA